jgi:lipopolysaccharide/colanic/teichoic acid biosynthesis glycosyltransferase
MMEVSQVQTNYVTVSVKRPYENVVKRVLDVVVATLALALLWPVMLLIAVLIRLDSKGPAFFVQKRIGKNGQPFSIYKFRTMTHNLDQTAHKKFMQAYIKGNMGSGECSKNGSSDVVYKPFSQAQVTRVGKVLRKASLDELPQLFNILKGEMSLVGPRPNVPYEVEAYKEWHMERLRVLPGITGLAQVNGRSALDFDSISRYDIEYVRRMSVGLDIKILIQTVTSVLKANGAH